MVIPMHRSQNWLNIIVNMQSISKSPSLSHLTRKSASTVAASSLRSQCSSSSNTIQRRCASSSQTSHRSVSIYPQRPRRNRHHECLIQQQRRWHSINHSYLSTSAATQNQHTAPTSFVPVPYITSIDGGMSHTTDLYSKLLKERIVLCMGEFHIHPPKCTC